MNKLIIATIVLFCCAFAARSQDDYKSALGFRAGYPASVSFKRFVTSSGAVEAFVGYRPFVYRESGYFISVIAMYQHHVPIAPIRGLKWYTGLGIGPFIETHYYQKDNHFNKYDFAAMGGIGFDYKFAKVPINLSLDWLPTFTVGEKLACLRDCTEYGFTVDHAALSVRYTFGKREKAAASAASGE